PGSLRQRRSPDPGRAIRMPRPTTRGRPTGTRKQRSGKPKSWRFTTSVDGQRPQNSSTGFRTYCSDSEEVNPLAAPANGLARAQPFAKRLRALVLLFFPRGLPLFEAVAAEHVGNRGVPFVAGVLVDQLVLVLQRDHRGPPSRPHRRIVDRELVIQ